MAIHFISIIYNFKEGYEYNTVMEMLRKFHSIHIFFENFEKRAGLRLFGTKASLKVFIVRDEASPVGTSSDFVHNHPRNIRNGKVGSDSSKMTFERNQFTKDFYTEILSQSMSARRHSRENTCTMFSWP